MSKQPESLAVVACLQFEPNVGCLDENVGRGAEMVEKAAAQGAGLVVLPELCDSGYVFETRKEAYSLSDTVEDSVAIRAWRDLAARLNIHIVGGFCERAGGALYNSAAIVGPDGVLGVYRKNHLWAAEALFFERGDVGFTVVTTALGRVAALICYDGWSPNAGAFAPCKGRTSFACRRPGCRCPTSLRTSWRWPTSCACPPRTAIRCSSPQPAAREPSAARPSSGRASSSATQAGRWPGRAGKTETTILMAECNLAEARCRRTLNEFNQVLRDRRADLYGEMLGAQARPGWY